MAANPKSEVLDSTENSSYPQYHVYHAEAHVLSGRPETSDQATD